MDKQKYSSALLNANYRSVVWMCVAGLLLISNVLLAGFVVTADTSEKTIVLPPDVDRPFFVKGNNVSPEYIEQMARYFSQLLLTYQKQNARSQFDTVLYHTDPAVYSDMKTRFAIEYDRISRNDISSVFHLMGIHIKQNMAILTGELNGYIGSHLVSRKEKTYEMQFRYNGKLMLTAFHELQKDSTGEYQIIRPVDEVYIDATDLGVDREVENDKE